MKPFMIYFSILIFIGYFGLGLTKELILFSILVFLFLLPPFLVIMTNKFSKASGIIVIIMCLFIFLFATDRLTSISIEMSYIITILPIVIVLSLIRTRLN